MLAVDGVSYERRVVEAWLRTNSTSGSSASQSGQSGLQWVSPVTNERVTSGVLVPNKSLKQAIMDFRGRGGNSTSSSSSDMVVGRPSDNQQASTQFVGGYVMGIEQT